MSELRYRVYDGDNLEATFKDDETAFEFCEMLLDNGAVEQRPVIFDSEAYIEGDACVWYDKDGWTHLAPTERLESEYPSPNLERDEGDLYDAREELNDVYRKQQGF